MPAARGLRDVVTVPVSLAAPAVAGGENRTACGAATRVDVAVFLAET